MSDIFISYAREDRAKAKAFAELFQQQNWSVWWDRNIPPGRSFDEVIEEALGAAKCVVVLWSKNSAASDWVKGEAAEALQRKILVPVRIDSANVPLEFRRLQTIDLSEWKADAGHPELGGLLDAVAANIKGIVVRRPVSEPSRRKFIKPAVTVLAIAALLVSGFAFYRFAGGVAKIGFRESPIPKDANPAGEELMRTPELGLEFWQRDQKNLMFSTEGEKHAIRVLLKRAPFEIRCPHFEAPVQICAWSDASIFDVIVAAKKLEDVPYFSPGTGRADTEFGSATLGLSNLSHHHFVPERRRVISSQQDSIFFSSVVNIEDGKKLADWPTVYLVVFVNSNQTDEIDPHEYECLILEFGK